MLSRSRNVGSSPNSSRLAKIEALSAMQSAMTGSYFVFWYLTCEWLNVESPKSAYNFILEIMEFFPSLALAWSLSDQTAESEVTVGCARPVNPLKLAQRCQHSIFELVTMKILQ